MQDENCLDAIVVGAGFGGVQMLYELQKLGLRACGIEAGGDVGGAWYWNRYPGARCDVESLLYSYSFSPELDEKWQWTERYPGQEEIQRYIGFAADLFDVRKLIGFNLFVTSAHHDDARNLWTVKLDTGEQLEARFLIMATGPLTAVVWPDIPGITDFKGECYHTARWPECASLTGKRIGVVGNGSSGTQFMTEASKSAGELHAFIRTAQFSVPAFNAPLTDEDYACWQASKERIRLELHQGLVSGAGDAFADRSVLFSSKRGKDYTAEEQSERLETFWNIGGAQLVKAFADIMVDDEANAIVGDFARSKIRGTIKDPVIAEIMTPKHFAFGGKRLIVDTGFYEIFNQDNVYPHDISISPIVRITENGVETTKGHIELDMLVFATGFDAVAGTLDRIDIRGRNGLRLTEHWKEGAKSCMGLAISEFPNLLMINGPGAPGPFSNVVISNEWMIESLVALLEFMTQHALTSVEATPANEREWMGLLERVAAPTFFAKTDSWYSGANIRGRKHGIVNYIDPVGFRQKLLAEVAANFESFKFGAAHRAS